MKRGHTSQEVTYWCGGAIKKFGEFYACTFFDTFPRINSRKQAFLNGWTYHKVWGYLCPECSKNIKTVEPLILKHEEQIRESK